MLTSPELIRDIVDLLPIETAPITEGNELVFKGENGEDPCRVIIYGEDCYEGIFGPETYYRTTMEDALLAIRSDLEVWDL